MRPGVYALVSFSCLLAWATPLRAADMQQALTAQTALYAARYGEAAQIYAEMVKTEPGWDAGYYGLVRALLGAERTKEAYAAAEAGAKAAPGTPGVETALGMVAFRQARIFEAENILGTRYA